MWTKIKAIGKQFAAKKAAEKATNTSDGQTLFDQLGKFKIAMGCFPIVALVFVLVAPLLVLIPSFSAIHLLQFVDPAYADETSSKGNGTGGPILLIAGHSFKPYCEQVNNECRAESVSDLSTGYFEAVETRSLVKLIKGELEALNVKVDIANQLMAPDDERMNTSFFVESTQNTSTFQAIDWTKYKYVLEVHFNGGGGSGPLLVKPESGYSTEADVGIIEAVTKNTGTKQGPDSIQGLNDLNYFKNKNIPITYLETEYSDNKAAMDHYTEKKSQIAKDIAKVIRETYGTGGGGEGYLQWAINTAEDNSHGYSQCNRTGPDYDCASLVWYSLVNNGFSEGELGGYPFSTLGMPDVLKKVGFTEHTYKSQDELEPGDILVNVDHAEIYVGDGKNVGAHSAENGEICGATGDQTGNEISVAPNPGGWTTYYRLKG